VGLEAGEGGPEEGGELERQRGKGTGRVCGECSSREEEWSSSSSCAMWKTGDLRVDILFGRTPRE
jgi:hypothetical protein